MKLEFHRLVGFVRDVRLAIAILGATLAIVLHELVHILLHASALEAISLMPNSHTIAEISFEPSAAGNLVGEEFLAYLVSAVVIIVTAVAIAHSSDKTSDRPAGEIIFGSETPFDGLSPLEISEIAYRSGLV